jgi:predicted ATP-dependent protease
VNLCKTGIADALVEQNSVNTGPSIQKGMIQPISGVDEKSEGVCGVCKGRGLTGDQGVIIQQRNVRTLMPRK